jgi:hypothetical protein
MDTTTDTTTNDADALDNARAILRSYINGKEIAGLEFQEDSQSTAVIASMLLSIAVEVRRLTNTLADLVDDQQLAESVKIWRGE